LPFASAAWWNLQRNPVVAGWLTSRRHHGTRKIFERANPSTVELTLCQFLGRTLILKEQEAGTPVADLCRTYGMHSETFYAWKRRHTGMQSGDVQKLKQVTEENARLRKVVANHSLEVDALKDALQNELVTTQAKRDMAFYLIERWSLSVRSACRLVHLSRTVFDSQAVPNDDNEVRVALRDLARKHPKYGCPMLAGILRARGFTVNHKRIERIYQEENLALRR